MTLQDLYRIRDAIAEGLRIRQNLLLTDAVIQDRAANITEYLRPIVEEIVEATLRDAARGEVITGSLHDEGDTVLGTIRPPEETTEELARRLIK